MRELRDRELAQLEILLRKYRRNGEGFFLGEQHEGKLPTREEFKVAALAIYKDLTFGREFPPEDLDRVMSAAESYPSGFPMSVHLAAPEGISGVTFAVSKDEEGDLHYWLVMMGGRVLRKVLSRTVDEYVSIEVGRRNHVDV